MFLMHILCTTDSLHCSIFMVFRKYTHLSWYCGHMQLYDMSVGNTLVIHNGTICVNMVFFLQNGYMCVLKDIVHMKQFWDKKLAHFIG